MPIFAIDARPITPHFPGIGRYLRSLIEAMPAQLSADERLVVLQHDDLHLNRSDKVLPIKTPASPFSIAQQWQIPKLLRYCGAHLYHSPYYLMPLRTGIRTVLTVYDTIPLKYPETVSVQARLLFLAANRLALRSADHVIAISENTRRDYLRTFNLQPAKITPIPLAADPSFHPQTQEEIERIRSKYELQSYILYVGINKPHKNLARLLEAWKLLELSGRPGGYRLVIAGPWDPRYPEPKQLTEALGIKDSIRFCGPVPAEDLPGLYAGASLFVYPSLYEGFGLPVLEAMACGVPVICARSPGLEEVAGDAALYFDPVQTGDLVRAIQQLLEDPPQQKALGVKGLYRAVLFSWQRTAQETLHIYRHILRI